jgi:hypothetical protein
MIRVYKHYTLNFVHAPPRIVSFSSYPAELHSEDDFYITPHLIVFETTNMVFSRNTSFIQANSTLLTWMRAIVANTLAQNGSSWASIFKRYNSGSAPPLHLPSRPTPPHRACSIQQSVGGGHPKHIPQPPQRTLRARWLRLDSRAAASMLAVLVAHTPSRIVQGYTEDGDVSDIVAQHVHWHSRVCVHCLMM